MTSQLNPFQFHAVTLQNLEKFKGGEYLLKAHLVFHTEAL